jgi:hypothetical protein
MPVQKTDAKWGKIAEASQSGMKSEASYNEVKRFYIRFFDEVLSKIEQQQPSQQLLQEGGGQLPSSIILGKRVREVFHLDDEAFILSAIRFFHNNKETTNLVTESTPGGGPPAPQDAGTTSLTLGDVGEGGAGGLLQILANALEMSHVLATQESSYPIDAPIFTLNEMTGGDSDDVVMRMTTSSGSTHQTRSHPQEQEENRGGKGNKGQEPATSTTAGSS